VKSGSTPASSIASQPLGVRGIAGELVRAALCTQPSRPAIRAPVSSKCATGAPVSSSRSRSSKSHSPAAAALTHAVSVPVETAAPARSPSSWQARS